MTAKSVIKLWKASRNKEDFKTKLTEKGFKYLGCGEYSVVYSRDDIDFVVKVGRGVCTRKLPKELEPFRLPYIYTNGNRQVAIQPKVNTEGRYEARKIINSACQKIDPSDYDVHQDNVGWLKGKPVIFDYL